MAFNLENWSKVSSSANGKAPVVYGYNADTDNKAAVEVSGYFDSISGRLKLNDTIYIDASDDQEWYRVTAVSPNVTIEATTGELDALTDGNLYVGSASNVPVGVAMSGDATMVNTGALTIADSVLDGSNAADHAAANAVGSLMEIHEIVTAGGATADTDLVITHKSKVVDVWCRVETVGSTSDTIQLKNGANVITDAMSIDIAQYAVARAGLINSANEEIAAGGTLRVTETDGGGSDSPATTVYVKVVRVA
jgi:hypothetical protein